MIESTLDLEAAKENEFIIRPDFDEALQSKLLPPTPLHVSPDNISSDLPIKMIEVLKSLENTCDPMPSR